MFTNNFANLKAQWYLGSLFTLMAFLNCVFNLKILQKSCLLCFVAKFAFLSKLIIWQINYQAKLLIFIIEFFFQKRPQQEPNDIIFTTVVKSLLCVFLILQLFSQNFFFVFKHKKLVAKYLKKFKTELTFTPNNYEPKKEYEQLQML